MERDDVDRELEREREERDGLIGDTEDNRNLSGSTTWETLPNQEASDDDDEDLPSDDPE